MTSQLPRGGQQGVRSVRLASRCGEGSGHQVAVQPPPLPSTLASRATCPAPLGAHVTETLSSSAFLLETVYSSCPTCVARRLGPVRGTGSCRAGSAPADSETGLRGAVAPATVTFLF